MWARARGTAAVAHNCFFFFSFHRILFLFGSLFFLISMHASIGRHSVPTTNTSCLLACRDKYSYMQRQRHLMMIMMMIRSHACIQSNVRLRQLRDVKYNNKCDSHSIAFLFVSCWIDDDSATYTSEQSLTNNVVNTSARAFTHDTISFEQPTSYTTQYLHVYSVSLRWWLCSWPIVNGFSSTAVQCWLRLNWKRIQTANRLRCERVFI